jgi:cytochrome P450
VIPVPLYDPLDPDVVSSPYAAYDALRENSPFWHVGMRCWIVMKYDLCIQVLKNSRIYVSDWRLAGIGHDTSSEEALGIQVLDGAAHTRLRSSFTRAMNSTVEMKTIQTSVRALMRSRLQEIPQGTPFDFVTTVGRPVSLEAICNVLGIEVPESDSFAAMAEALIRGMDAGLIPEREEPAKRAKQELNALIAQWSEYRFLPYSNGILQKTLNSAAEYGIPEQQILSTARQFFLAGYSTTVAAAANAIFAIATDRELSESLQQNPALIPATIEELLRLDGPVQGTSRALSADATLGDVPMRRGEIVLCLFGAANRDPEVFPDANHIDITRVGNRHLGFGWGPHACTGALFARDVLKVIVEEVLATGLPRIVGSSAP